MWTLTLSDGSSQFCIHTSSNEQYRLLLAGIKMNTRFTLINTEYVKG